MAKITMILSKQNSTELEPRNFTQVGGIYGDAEIRPEEFLTEYANEGGVEQPNDERDPRFFTVK
jgi:hypothetical protein